MSGMGPCRAAIRSEVEYQHGTADLQAGKYRDAVTDFEHVTEVTPRAANAWLMLGMSKEGAGDEKGAEKAYEKSVKLDDTSVQAHRELAPAADQAEADRQGQRRTGDAEGARRRPAPTPAPTPPT